MIPKVLVDSQETSQFLGIPTTLRLAISYSASLAGRRNLVIIQKMTHFNSEVTLASHEAAAAAAGAMAAAPVRITADICTTVARLVGSLSGSRSQPHDVTPTFQRILAA